ncbi:MAG: ABC transporter substrate-binding protein [Breznakia sp.]
MRIRIFVFLLCGLLVFSGCSSSTKKANQTNDTIIEVSDKEGNALQFKKTPTRVVALSSSWADLWLLAGGSLIGTTSDVEDRNLETDNVLSIVGTVKEPNMEEVLGLEPDFVILSQDISSHKNIANTLKDAKIPYYVTKVETFNDYLKVLKDFTTITQKNDHYQTYGKKLEMKVDTLLEKRPNNQQPSALFMRAFSTGVKAKASDHVVCTILDDIGVNNIATQEGFPLEDISMEAIIEADPDYIFITMMGDEADAKQSVKTSLESHPTWQTLQAVKNHNVVFLEKELYQYKPNARWADAYETILKIVYPDVYK